MSPTESIKKLCDTSLEKLFSDKKWEKIKEKKLRKGTTDPLFSERDGRMAFIIHSVTIRSGIILENLYLEAVKSTCTNLDVWSEKKFRISGHAMNQAQDQDNEEVMDGDLPYGQAVKIGNKKKTRQIDLFTYDRVNKILNSYEIKRAGGHHDSEKKEKIIENLIAVQLLLKSYGEKEKKIEVKRRNSFIIAHMNEDLFPSEYSSLQISGKDVDNHFNAAVSKKINEGYGYFVKEFRRRFAIIKSISI